jgi:cytochrome c556
MADRFMRGARNLKRTGANNNKQDNETKKFAKIESDIVKLTSQIGELERKLRSRINADKKLIKDDLNKLESAMTRSMKEIEAKAANAETDALKRLENEFQLFKAQYAKRWADFDLSADGEYIDFHNKKAKNLVRGTAPHDAVNFQQFETSIINCNNRINILMKTRPDIGKFLSLDDDKFNARYLRITDVGAPSRATDAVNLNYVSGEILRLENLISKLK